MQCEPLLRLLEPLRAEAVVALVHEHAGTGLAAVAISSNSVETHPQDGPELMVEDAKQFGDGLALLNRLCASKAYWG